MLGLCLGLPISPAIQAGQIVAHALTVEQARIHPAPPQAPVRAGFARLHNAGEQDLVIDAMRSPTFGKIELHEMHMEGGLMRMRPVASLRVPARGEVELKPGGLHLMLFQPVQSLELGSTARIEFLSGDEVVASVEFIVASSDGKPTSNAPVDGSTN